MIDNNYADKTTLTKDLCLVYPYTLALDVNLILLIFGHLPISTLMIVASVASGDVCSTFAYAERITFCKMAHDFLGRYVRVLRASLTFLLLTIFAINSIFVADVIA